METREKERKLRALAKSVPYAERLEDVATRRNPQRLLEETEAFRAAVTAVETKPMYRETGFADIKLMEDSRFRVATVLFEAGLHRSGYAQDIMRAMAPPRDTNRVGFG